MPTPPKESIKGTKGHQIAAFEFAKKQFEYVSNLENFTADKDFTELSKTEQIYIKKEIEQQNFAYETLRLRVEDY